MNIVRNFLDTNPSTAKTADEARFKGKLANALNDLAQNLGFSDRAEFDTKYTHVAMQHVADLVSSASGLGGRDVSRDDVSPAGIGISGKGNYLA